MERLSRQVEHKPPTVLELARARAEWHAINWLVKLNIEGTVHAGLINEHLARGGSVALLPRHRTHADSLILLRVKNEIAGDNTGQVGFAVSDKLFPGGDLYKNDGRRAFAHAQNLSFKLFRTVQSNAKDKSPVNPEAFREMRGHLCTKGACLGYYVEGSRYPVKMAEAKPGVVELFADPLHVTADKLKERLYDNQQTLGVPISLGDTPNLLTKKKRVNIQRLASDPFVVRVGQPFYATDILSDIQKFGLPDYDRKELIKSFALAIGTRIASLVDVNDRGHYGVKEYQKIIAYSEIRNNYEYGTWPSR